MVFANVPPEYVGKERLFNPFTSELLNTTLTCAKSLKMSNGDIKILGTVKYTNIDAVISTIVKQATMSDKNAERGTWFLYHAMVELGIELLLWLKNVDTSSERTTRLSSFVQII